MVVYSQILVKILQSLDYAFVCAERKKESFLKILIIVSLNKNNKFRVQGK